MTQRGAKQHCQDGELGLKEEERGEGGECGSTTGSRMSAAPRRPRPTTGDSRPEQNNDLASLSERDQLNGVGGGDSRERSGSRRGRRRVASLRGGEKGRARQNQGQVSDSATVHIKPILIRAFFLIILCTLADRIIQFAFLHDGFQKLASPLASPILSNAIPVSASFFRKHQNTNLIQVKCSWKVKTC